MRVPTQLEHPLAVRAPVESLFPKVPSKESFELPLPNGRQVRRLHEHQLASDEAKPTEPAGALVYRKSRSSNVGNASVRW